MALHRLANQPCWPRLSCHPISINNMVHIDTFDQTRWPQKPIFMALHRLRLNRADLVCYATQQHGAYRHIQLNISAPATHFHGLVLFNDSTMLTSSIMPPNHWQPIIIALWQINHFRLSLAMSYVYACANYQFSSSIHNHSNTTSQ